MWLLFREILGWVLVLAGSAMIVLVCQLALERSVLEAIAITVPATIVFRAGIGFLRITTAARLAKKL